MIGFIFIVLVVGAYEIWQFHKLNQKEENLNKIDSERQSQNLLIEAENLKLKTERNELLEEVQKVRDSHHQEIQNLKEQTEEFKNLNEKQIQSHYDNVVRECQNNLVNIKLVFEAEELEKQEEMERLNKELERMRSLVNAATAARQRAQEEKDKENFYRIQISDLDVQEIKKIREIEPYLRDITPLNKVIWSTYYQNPFNAMAGRVIGPQEKTGIYKITNLSNGMAYIGQAKKIKERWREHVKKGIGADSPNKNKLYPALLSNGVENFSFEILEECDFDSLNERERFWIDYYQTKTYGYNITAGNKNKEN